MTFFEFHAQILGDQAARAQNRDVLEHGLAPVAEPGGLDRRDLEAAAQLVDDQRRQRLAVDIFSDDEQRLSRLDDRLEERQHRLQRGELLLVNEDVRILQLDDHFFGIGDEVRREIAAIELHALDDVEFGFGGLGFLDGDDALGADFLHRLGDHFADRLVAVGRDRADLGDLLRGLHLLGAALDVFDHRRHRDVDAALQVHRVHAGGDELEALAHDRRGQDRRRRRAVAGEIIGLRGDFAHHLRAHVLEFVGELDFLGHGDAVLGDVRRAVGLVENDVATFGTERHLDGVIENFDSAQHALACVGGKSYVFGGHGFRSNR